MIFRPELFEQILAGETEAARILEPGYVGSVRRYHSRWREENRAGWQEYHQGQAARHRAVLESLIARHEARPRGWKQPNRKEHRNGEIWQRLQGAGGHKPEDARQLPGLCGPLPAFAKAGPRGSRRACRQACRQEGRSAGLLGRAAGGIEKEETAT